MSLVETRMGFKVLLYDELPFSPRQNELVWSLVEGYTAQKELAKKMEVSQNTIKNYLSGIDPTGDTYIEQGIYTQIERWMGVRPNNYAGVIHFLAVNGYLLYPEPKSLVNEDNS